MTAPTIRRRDMLKLGVLGSTGLTLAGYLRQAAAGTIRPQATAKSGIFIYMSGGPSHMDTFDLKPEAPSEYRGEFKPIKTNVSGVEISEHLPKLAQVADKYVIMRGVTHGLAAHEFGRAYMTTGNAPLASLTFPGYGSIVSKERPTLPDLPPYVAVPRTPETAGYLGVQYTALSTSSTPVRGQPFAVRGMALQKGTSTADVTRRRELLDDLDRTFASLGEKDDLLKGLDRFSHQAYDIISSPRSREAFDVNQEPAPIVDRFGDHSFGQSCLLACRLIEAGVRFVTIDIGGWDTHRDNFTALKDRLLPQLDQGVAAMLSTLAERGLLDSTAVQMCGEFGRTPKVNKDAGRDHWPRAMFVLLAGGGMRGGQVLGASNEKGEVPADGTGYSPDQIAATYLHTFGIDYNMEYHEATGRPITLIRHGSLINGLVS